MSLFTNDMIVYVGNPIESPETLETISYSKFAGNGNPLQYLCLENPRDSLVGHSPRGRKAPDTAGWLHSARYSVSIEKAVTSLCVSDEQVGYELKSAIPSTSEPQK